VLIVYDSLTGNVERFIKKLGDVQSIKIEDGLIVDEKFILITYTIGFGEVPPTVEDFLWDNHENLIGVAASGNKIWGDNFTKSSEIISEEWNVPIIHRFELSGTKKDVEYFLQEAKRIDEQYSRMD